MSTKKGFWYNLKNKALTALNWLGSGFGANDWSSYDGKEHKGWLFGDGTPADVLEDTIGDLLGTSQEGKSNSLFGTPGFWNALTSYLNSKTGASLTGAQREQNVFNAEQAAIDRGWQERMSNSAYQRAVVDMGAAGLNPALMYGSGAAASTPSGAVASGGSPGVSSELGLMSLIMQSRLKKQELKNAKEIAKDQSDTAVEVAEINAGVGEHANEIREKELNQRIIEARSKTKLEEEQAKTEESKRAAIEKQMFLDEATAERIKELLPYEKAYMTADTADKRWSAELNMVKAGLQNSLISNGLVHYMMENYRLGTDISELKRDIMKLSYDFEKDKDTPAFHFVHKVSSVISGVTDAYLVDPNLVFELLR